MSWAGMVVQGAIGTNSAILTYFGAERQKDVLRSNRAVQKRRTKLEQEQRRRRERKLIGQQVAATAAGGIQVGTGTSLSLLEEISAASRREQNRISYEGSLALANIDNAIDTASIQQILNMHTQFAGGAAGATSAAASSGKTEKKGETESLLSRSTTQRQGGSLQRGEFKSRVA